MPRTTHICPNHSFFRQIVLTTNANIENRKQELITNFIHKLKLEAQKGNFFAEISENMISDYDIDIISSDSEINSIIDNIKKLNHKVKGFSSVIITCLWENSSTNLGLMLHNLSSDSYAKMLYNTKKEIEELAYNMANNGYYTAQYGIFHTAAKFVEVICNDPYIGPIITEYKKNVTQDKNTDELYSGILILNWLNSSSPLGQELSKKTWQVVLLQYNDYKNSIIREIKFNACLGIAGINKYFDNSKKRIVEMLIEDEEFAGFNININYFESDKMPIMGCITVAW